MQANNVSNNSISAVVVLYNPEQQSTIENIKSYLPYINNLIIVDNSSEESNIVRNEFREFSKVTYLPLMNNEGIAHALNLGIKHAQDNKSTWLLTMDQDSEFLEGKFETFVKIVTEESKSKEKAALFSPKHSSPHIIEGVGVQKVKSAMASGNLIKMEYIQQIGLFDEKLFIDSVDHEFCYRINQLGLEVYRVNQVELDHNLGDITTRKLLGKKIYVTNHNYVRRYYMTRNSLYVRKKYSDNLLKLIEFNIAYSLFTVVTIGLFEQDRFRKYKSFFAGYSDFLRGRLGKKSF